LTADFSIVFLHGLTGHREETWTAENESEPWPKLLLPSDIPNARIIVYGYDADVVRWTKPAGQNNVREHAQNLVNDLCAFRARTRTPKQPVLFVAHSLGGLVCQDALLLCVNPSDEAQATLLDSTRGVAFMGTPNAGSDFEKFATGIANIISLSFVKAPNTQLLEVLRARSQVLSNIKNGFLTMVRRRLQIDRHEIKIHAFVEELPVIATGHVSIESVSNLESHV
jgi:pimeloyl-ACP methyl ester carboxylesterase